NYISSLINSQILPQETNIQTKANNFTTDNQFINPYDTDNINPYNNNNINSHTNDMRQYMLSHGINSVMPSNGNSEQSTYYNNTTLPLSNDHENNKKNKDYDKRKSSRRDYSRSTPELSNQRSSNN